MDVKITGLDGVIDTLKSLPPEIVSKRGGPVRAALRKAAVVIQKKELENLAISLANAPRYSTGLLEKNIIVTRGKAPFGGNGERYLVRVRRKVYPDRVGRSRGGKVTTTLAAANLLEYGSSKQKAEPFIRPAVQQAGARAIQTFQDSLSKNIQRIIKKLAKANASK
jgi:HK97 gp10 family phage protein